MANTFINRLVTKIEFQGAGAYSNLLFGVGRGFDHLQQRATAAAAKVQAAGKAIEASQDALRTAGAARNVAQGAFAAQQNTVTAMRAAMPQGFSPAQIAQAANRAASDIAKQRSAELAQANQALKVNAAKIQQQAAKDQLTYLRRHVGALIHAGAPQIRVDAARNALHQGRGHFAQAGADLQAQQNILQNRDAALMAARNAAGASAARYQNMRGQPGPTPQQVAALKAAEAQLLVIRRQLTTASGAYAVSLRQAQAALLRHTAATQAQIAADKELQAAQASLKRGLIIGGAIAAATAIFSFGKAAAETAIRFEVLQTQLDFLFKSQEKGRQAFRWAQDFATKTPFDVEQVVGAFRDLAVFGLQPTAQRMKALGSLAALFRRDFSDAVKAVGFGLEGNFARLQRGFAITRKQIAAFQQMRGGPRLFDNAGKIINREALEKALFDFLQVKYGKAMEAMEQTTVVKLGNVKDAWTNFLGAVGQSELGPIKDFSDMLISTLGWMTENLPRATILWNGLSEAVIYFSGALAGVVKMLSYVVPGSLGKSMRADADAFIGASKDRLKELYKSSDAAREALRTGNHPGAEPPGLPKSDIPRGGDFGGGMSQAVQQILGGLGDAAKYQLKASELPGRNDRGIKQTTFKVRLLGQHGKIEDGVVDIFEQLLGELQRSGAITINAGAT